MKITLISPETQEVTNSISKPILDTLKEIMTISFVDKVGKFGITGRNYLNRVTPHRGLLLIASILKKSGHSVKYFEMDYYLKKSDQNIINSIYNFLRDSDLVGVTSYTANFNKAIKYLELAKSANPNIISVIGGPHVSYRDFETVENHKCVDIVVRGEGENTIKEIVDGIEKHHDLNLLIDVKGITFKDKKSNKIFKNGDRKPLQLDNSIIPDYDLLPNEDRFLFSPIIETRRGCPFACSFCLEAIIPKTKRAKEIDVVIQELSEIKNKFNPEYVFITDSIFTVNKKQVLELCDKLKKEKIDCYFGCNVRADLVDDSLIENMSSANFIEFFLGIESYSQNVLNAMQKQITPKQYDDFLIKTKNRIPIITTSWIIGHPGEDIKSINESLKAVIRLIKSDMITISEPKSFVPYPGTPLFEFPDAHSMEILTYEWKNYSRYSFPVYRLRTLSEDEIFQNTLNFQKTVIKETCKKLKVLKNDILV